MTSRRPSLRSPRRAFTLLEVLIATAVGAIVLLVVNATFFGALRLHDTTQARLREERALQRALGIVRRDLAGVMLPSNTAVLAGPLQTTLASALTAGTYGDRIGPDFYTNSGAVDGWSPFSEVQVVDYYLAPATDGSNAKTLMRAVTRNLLPAQTSTPDLQPLLNGVADASIDFYDGTSWTDAWDSSATSTMPKAIRFQLTLLGADGKADTQAPVTLVVPVLVATVGNLAEDAAASAGGAP